MRLFHFTFFYVLLYVSRPLPSNPRAAFTSAPGITTISVRDFQPSQRRSVLCPDEPAIDGEIVALDGAGHASFNILQNGGSKATIIYYVFDMMLLAGRDITGETLDSRRAILEREVLPNLAEPIRYS
jgi:hypothetical protein